METIIMLDISEMNTDGREIQPATERRVSETLEVDDKDHIVIHDDHAIPHLDEKPGAPKAVGTAVIDITHTIPTTGLRKVTTKWEYWTYCAFCKCCSAGHRITRRS